MKSRFLTPLFLALLALLCCAQTPAPAENSDPNLKPTAESELTLAAREISFFDYRTAEPHFDKALALAAPNSDAWALATYGKATCLYNISPIAPENIDQAKALYTKLFETRPDHRSGRLAGLALGRIAELKDFIADPVDLPAARIWYQAVIDKASDSPEADQAALRLAGTYIQTYDKTQCLQGIDILKKHLAAHPQNPLASGMYQYIGDTYFYPLNNDKAALENYIKADSLGLSATGKEAILYWRMAILADQKLSDPKTAIIYYRKILDITPTSGKSYEARLAIDRLSASTSPSSTQDAGHRTLDASPPPLEAKP